MITQKEITAVELSPTKKDFYQIWNELLDTASKISERWDPTSTNESDPGIVLLKVLTAIADKLNYNIDKNTLEAFMPSAAQQESMRKLTEMLGYSMKYYQSAETTATITWIGGTENGNLKIKDDATTLQEYELPIFTPLKDSNGNVVYTTTDFAVFSNTNLTNEIPCIEGEVVQCTTDTDNIITSLNLDDNKRYFLPETQIAENGIFVFNVANGVSNFNERWEKVENLNTQPLNSKVYKFGYSSKELRPYIQFPDDIETIIEDGLLIYFTRTTGVNGNIKANVLSTLELNSSSENNDDTKGTVNSSSFTVTNKTAATNGSNIETLTQAYNNYKRTIGTFDTLVTCRDYINKIYQLTDAHNNPLVSNVIVSDIRDDINRAVQLCTFNEFGISYKDIPDNNRITNFDLVIYPFKTVHGLNTEQEYTDSFEHSLENLNLIEMGIDRNKTISHKINTAEPNDIICIKNYLKLEAKITTTTKVNATEQKSILENIYKAIYTNFNARQVEFGENIPFDSILTVIENADPRIKNVAMYDPKIETRFLTTDGELSLKDEKDIELYKKAFDKIVVKNVLAGKVALFNYTKLFKPSLNESPYPSDASGSSFANVYENIKKIETSCTVPVPVNNVELKDNEVIQFRAPNFKTEITYPAYVNYYAQLDTKNSTDSIPASFISLATYINGHKPEFNEFLANNFIENDLAAYVLDVGHKSSDYGLAIKWDETSKKWKTDSTGDHYCPINSDTFAKWYTWVKGMTYTIGSKTYNYIGICKQLASDILNIPGSMVDRDSHKYISITSALSTDKLTSYFIQNVTTNTEGKIDNGLGKDAKIVGASKNGEYCLDIGEYLFINYTKSSTATEGDSTAVKTPVYVYYGPGTVIKPNFDLKPSDLVKRQGISTTKTIAAGTKFTKMSDDNEKQELPLPDGVTGMYTLGASEQIEIRKPVIVDFKPDDDEDSKNIFVYWELNNKSKTFDFDKDGKYVLQDGEYFFYTDINKSEMAWYGSGCEIRSEHINSIVKPDTVTSVTIEDILENGIDVVPWIKVTVTKTSYLSVYEYQFITLTTGDTLKTITLKNGETELNGGFVDCTEATYILNNEESTLPEINIKDNGWQVASFLNLNLGPNLTQTLKSTRDCIKITYENSEGIEEPPVYFRPTDDAEPLSVKANVLCQTALSTIDTASFENITNFAIEPFAQKDIKINYPSTAEGNAEEKEVLPLNNFGTNWTKFSFGAYNQYKYGDDSKNFVPLNIKVDSQQFGLLMIYYRQANSENTAYLTVDAGNLVVYNKKDTNGNEIWWENKVSGAEVTPTQYKLRHGINVIKISTSCELKVHKASNEGWDDIFIISDLDIVDASEHNGLNHDMLQYYGSEADILKAIADADPEHLFYYNNVIDNSNVIDFNTDVGENLATPEILYDYNNVANKFVISEIDAEYMKTGITIARTSRL